MSDRILDPTQDAFTELVGESVIGNQRGGLQVAAQDVIPFRGNRAFRNIEVTVGSGDQGRQLQLGIAGIRPFAVEDFKIAVRQAAHAGVRRVAGPRMAEGALVESVLVEGER